MRTIESDINFMIDIDDTLCLWDIPPEANPDDIIKLKCGDGQYVNVLIHRKHVELVKQFAARGHTVFLWSQGGWQWAETVAIALGLDALNPIIMCKPRWYCDDLPASAWMGQPIYLDPFTGKKQEGTRT